MVWVSETKEGFTKDQKIDHPRQMIPGGQELSGLASLTFIFLLPVLWPAVHQFVIFWRLFLEASILVDLFMLTRNEMSLYFVSGYFPLVFVGSFELSVSK